MKWVGIFQVGTFSVRTFLGNLPKGSLMGGDILGGILPGGNFPRTLWEHVLVTNEHSFFRLFCGTNTTQYFKKIAFYRCYIKKLDRYFCLQFLVLKNQFWRWKTCFLVQIVALGLKFLCSLISMKSWSDSECNEHFNA